MSDREGAKVSGGERLDWLRSELLDRRWREAAAPEAAAVTTTAEPDDPIAWCARLRELVLARHGEGGALARLVAELGRLTGLRFPRSGAPAGESAKIDARLEQLIAQIEDLADAADLAEGRR